MKKFIMLLIFSLVVAYLAASSLAQVEAREIKVLTGGKELLTTIVEKQNINCQSDSDCQGVFCPQAIGMDTPMCENGKCVCGPGRDPAKLQLIEKNRERINFCFQLRLKLRELIITNASSEEVEKLLQQYNECLPQPLNKTEIVEKLTNTIQKINKEKVENLRELQEKLDEIREAKIDLILAQNLTGKELAEKIKELNEEKKEAIKEFVEKVHELNLERQEAIKELVIGRHVDIEGMKFNITKVTIMVNNQTIEIYPGDNVTINVSGILVKSKIKLKIKNNTLEDNETNETIKELPNEVQEKLRERERLKIKEMVLERTQKGLAYVVAAEKPGRLLGIIPINLQVNYQVSAENGQTISVNKPWWSIFVLS